ncbi:hypothetical protein D3C75_783040 [compost metagenome]
MNVDCVIWSCGADDVNHFAVQQWLSELVRDVNVEFTCNASALVHHVRTLFIWTHWEVGTDWRWCFTLWTIYWSVIVLEVKAFGHYSSSGLNIVWNSLIEFFSISNTSLVPGSASNRSYTHQKYVCPANSAGVNVKRLAFLAISLILLLVSEKSNAVLSEIYAAVTSTS